ncbi:MAG: glycosyltransferase family 4 protein, partial [Chromatocurvus sp.]
MRVLTVLTYYRPHTSGLTLYAQRLATAQTQRGHEVTVLTTRHEHGLPTESEEAGVRVVRTPVWFRLGKGVISPILYFRAASLIRHHDVVLLHLPQFDGAGIALLARLRGVPLVVTYHCDLLLPPGLSNRLVNAVMWMADRITGTLAAAVVAYTEDFAAHSPFLRRFAGKCRTVLPPVPPLSAAPAPLPEVAEHIHSAPILGMATRFASEKGIEILLDALPTIERQHPGVKVLFAGQYQDVWGEQTYLEKLLPRIRVLQEQGRWRFLG